MTRALTLLIATLTTGCVFLVDDAPVEVAHRTAKLDASPEHLVLTSRDANLTVIGVDGLTGMTVDAWLWSDGPSDAGNLGAIAAFEPTLVMGHKGVAELVIPTPSLATGLSADVVVLVPAEMSLDVLDDGGDVTVQHLAQVVVDDASGDLTIEDIAGDVDVVDGSGDLSLTGIGGDVFVDDGSGDAVLAEIRGHLTLTDGGGDATLSQVLGRVTVDDGSGDLTLRELPSPVTVRDGSGDIDATEVPFLDIVEDSSGDVTVR